MKLSQLTTQQFARIQKLLKTRESLMREVADIDAELESIETGKASRKTEEVAGEPGGRRGKLKGAILIELKASGPNGVELGPLAEKLGATKTQVSTWFATTGKKFGQIKKLGRGKFAWVEEAAQ